MEVILSTLNSIPSPYSDLVAVAVIFVLIALISLIIVFLFGGKAPEQTQELETQQDIESLEPEEIEAAADLEVASEAIEEVPEVQGQEFQTYIPEAGEEIVETETPIEDIQEEIRTEDIEEEPEEELTQEAEETKEGLFAKLRRGLSKTHAGLLGGLGEIISKREVNDNLWDDFEETLIMADLGVNTTMKLRANIESKLSKKSLPK